VYTLSFFLFKMKFVS